MPRWIRLAGYVIGTRALCELAGIAGTYFPRLSMDWLGEADGLLYKHLPVRWLDLWGRWDANFYIELASSGYPEPTGGAVYHAAFFPLVPLGMRAISSVTGAHPLVAGILLSNLLLVLAVLLFDRLASRDLGPEGAERAILFLLFFPGALWLSAPYTEAAFLFFSVASMLCARDRRDALMALSLAGAALTRPHGILLTAAVAVELAHARGWRPTWRWLWLLVPAAALGAHCAFLAGRYGDPLYFLTLQAAWGRELCNPLSAFLTWNHFPDYHAAALLSLAAVVAGWRTTERPSHVLLAAAQALIPLASGTLKSFPRLMAPNFALFTIAARVLHSRRAVIGYLAVTLPLLAFYAFQLGQYGGRK